MDQELAEMILLDHYKNPRNKGDGWGSEKSAYRGEAVNPNCGDSFSLSIDVDETVEPKAIKAVQFAGQGCALSVAATSILFAQLAEKSVAEAAAFLEGYLDRVEAQLESLPTVRGQKMEFPEEVTALFFASNNPARALCASISGQKALKILQNL